MPISDTALLDRLTTSQLRPSAGRWLTARSLSERGWEPLRFSPHLAADPAAGTQVTIGRGHHPGDTLNLHAAVSHMPGLSDSQLPARMLFAAITLDQPLQGIVVKRLTMGSFPTHVADWGLWSMRGHGRWRQLELGTAHTIGEPTALVVTSHRRSLPEPVLIALARPFESVATGTGRNYMPTDRVPRTTSAAAVVRDYIYPASHWSDSPRSRHATLRTRDAIAFAALGLRGLLPGATTWDRVFARHCELTGSSSGIRDSYRGAALRAAIAPRNGPELAELAALVDVYGLPTISWLLASGEPKGGQHHLAAIARDLVEARVIDDDVLHAALGLSRPILDGAES